MKLIPFEFVSTRAFAPDTLFQRLVAKLCPLGYLITVVFENLLGEELLELREARKRKGYAVLQKLFVFTASNLALDETKSALESILKEFVVFLCIILQSFLFLLDELFAVWIFAKLVLKGTQHIIFLV
jgi:hypothetical protein